MPPTPTPREPNPDKPLMYNLGAFFGEIIKAVKTPVDSPTPPRTHIRRETHEAHIHTKDGPVHLRRTITDEIAPPPPPRL